MAKKPKLAYWQQLQDSRWQKRRLEILQRGSFTCEACGDVAEGEGLQIHHKFYQKGLMAWEYPDTALLCVCESCHENIAEYERLLLSTIKPKDTPDILDLAAAIDAANKRAIPLRKCVNAMLDFIKAQDEVPS